MIQGRDKKGVISAKTRIDILVESGRQKIPFTHFLSLPIQHPLITESYDIFKNEVLASCSGVGGKLEIMVYGDRAWRLLTILN